MFQKYIYKMLKTILLNWLYVLEILFAKSVLFKWTIIEISLYTKQKIDLYLCRETKNLVSTYIGCSKSLNNLGYFVWE